MHVPIAPRCAVLGAVAWGVLPVVVGRVHLELLGAVCVKVIEGGCCLFVVRAFVLVCFLCAKGSCKASTLPECKTRLWWGVWSEFDCQWVEVLGGEGWLLLPIAQTIAHNIAVANLEWLQPVLGHGVQGGHCGWFLDTECWSGCSVVQAKVLYGHRDEGYTSQWVSVCQFWVFRRGVSICCWDMQVGSVHPLGCIDMMTDTVLSQNEGVQSMPWVVIFH